MRYTATIAQRRPDREARFQANQQMHVDHAQAMMGRIQDVSLRKDGGSAKQARNYLSLAQRLISKCEARGHTRAKRVYQRAFDRCRYRLRAAVAFAV